MGFKYETHLHTAEGSGCSEVRARELVRYYLDRGYAGIVVTDHFTGKTTVPPSCGWKDRVDHFFTGFDAAKEEGDRVGLDVFFSLEHSDKGNDFLFYGIGRDFLLANPDYREISLVQLLKRVRDAGGYVIHAHPFLRRPWVSEVRLVPELTDAVEVINGGDLSDPFNAKFDRAAAWYADEYGFKTTGGTDIHRFSNIRLTGIELVRRASSIFDVIEQIKKDECKVIAPIAIP